MIRFFKYHAIINKRTIKANSRKWLFSFLGSFLGISFVFLTHLFIQKITPFDTVMIIGSLGASVVIIFGTPQSPYAMPRHVIGGHVISAIVGVLCYNLFGITEYLWFCCALAVSLSVLLMQISRTTHPPGGATALIAVMGSEKIHALKYFYVITPVFTGVLVLLGTSAFMHWIKKQIKL
jgi:CBS-domain-containing membrane protein